MSLANGTRLGPYEIVAHIGAGGMGDVYKARDTRLNRFVALKTSQEKYSERFEREMRAIASLSHPNVCALYDVGPDFLVMELLEGQTLHQVMQSRRVPAEEAVRIAQQMAEALHAAHAKGITHRDIKPGNVFVSPRGHVKVLDFGLAKMTAGPVGDETQTIAADLSHPGTAMGTVAYMAPEQARGLELDARADLWALGVVLYEALTGARPFEGATNAVVFDAIFNRTPRPCGSNPEIDQVVGKLLEKDRDLRYQSAADVSADLRRAERSSVGTIAAAVAVPVRKPDPRWAIIVVSGFLVVGGVTRFVYSHLKSPLIASKDIIVVADFDNKTGDPVFDGTLREALATKLQQSGLILPMSDGQVKELLKEAKRDLNAPITADLAHELCIRAGEKATLTGSISALGSSYVLMLKTTGCQQGNVLASAQVEAQSKEKVMAALSTAVDALREKLGETLAATSREGKISEIPITTASLEAYQAYAAGMRQYRSGEVAASIANFHHARELDPNFAFAWRMEGSASGAIGQSTPFGQKAYELREYASPAERLLLEAGRGDVDTFRAAMEQLLQMTPRSNEALGGLGAVYLRLGDFDRAIEMRKRQLEGDPFAIGNYIIMMDTYIAADKFAEAKAVAEMPFSKKADAPFIRARLLKIAFMEGDLAEAAKQEKLMEPTTQHWEALAHRLNYNLAIGKFRDAEAIIPALREIDRRTNSQRLAAGASNDLRNAKEGAWDCDHLRYMAGPPLDVEVCGDMAKMIADDEKALARPDIAPDNASLARARIALAKHQPQQAIEALEPLRRFDTTTSIPALRGLAYVELKKPAEAAAEFRKLIARKSRLFDADYPWAHVQLARALAQSGSTAEAKKTYETFFALGKDADPGLPLMDAARKEYAALR